MDSWLPIIGLVLTALGLVLTGLGFYFGLLPVRDRTRKDFERVQPNVLIRGTSIRPSRHSLFAHLDLWNPGSVIAYDGTVSLDGLPDEADVREIHPMPTGIWNVYQVWLELKPDSPIRNTRLETPRLRIRYRDRWDYWYELSYPVTQTQREDGLFDIRIHTEDPLLRRPCVAFFKMRKHLHETP